MFWNNTLHSFPDNMPYYLRWQWQVAWLSLLLETAWRWNKSCVVQQNEQLAAGKQRVPPKKQNFNNNNIKIPFITLYHQMIPFMDSDSSFSPGYSLMIQKSVPARLYYNLGCHRANCLRVWPGFSCIHTGIWRDSSRLHTKFLKSCAYLVQVGQNLSSGSVRATMMPGVASVTNPFYIVKSASNR